ncbi:hypothetical protein OCF84_20960 (plasmid) [Shewanella xiamenensis]|uniref:HRDC domain-containing protein n=1 Tax=Shewanella xiamenensis TaxID=332186 RepID=A0ABT6UFL5_9GAMM|nr:hypothetical protein [Shewanella xiamenensis]MDI5833259.1 hypothetical protein [Shewanella xiamenensis]WHF57990.1 hypothetical protein OCF84_20960 [Shewanella xiamenensis]
MKNIFGFKYLFHFQQQIIKFLSKNNDLVVTAPAASGVKTAILNHCIINKARCILFIRSLDSISKTLSILDKYGVKAEGVSSLLSVKNRSSAIHQFVIGNLDCLICTPDQVKLFNERHISSLCNSDSQIVLVLFDAHRVYPESYRFNPTYNVTNNFIQNLCVSSYEISGKKLINSVLVSDCISSSELSELAKKSNPNPIAVCSQRRFENTKLSTKFSHLESSNNSILSYLKRNSFHSILVYTPYHSINDTMALLRANLTETILDTLPSPSELEKSHIVVSSSPYLAVLNKFDLILINGLPSNFSHLTPFLDSGTKVMIHYSQTDIDSVKFNYLESSSVGSPIRHLIDTLHCQPLNKDINAVSFAGKHSDVKDLNNYHRALEVLALSGLIKVSRKQGKISIFQRSSLSSNGSIDSAIASASNRAKRLSEQTIALVNSDACLQQRFNEILMASDGIRCGQCEICQSDFRPSARPDSPLSFSESNTLRAMLVNYRNSLTSDLPLKVLLPNAALEQVIELLPLSTKELATLDSFKGNNRIELFGGDILKVVSRFLQRLD